MKWTDAIKQASKELKASGKISAGKSRPTKSKTTTTRKPVTKRIIGAAKKKVSTPSTIFFKAENLNKTNTRYKYRGRYYEVLDDQDGENYILVNSKAVYFKTPKYIQRKLKKFGEIKKTKAAANKLVKRSTPKRKVSGSHTDTKSHNVRINVLSGVRPAPIVLNGVGRLVKNKYYIYNGGVIHPIVGLKGATDWKGSLMKYLGKKGNSLLFDIRFKLKNKAGFDSITERWELPSTLPANTFIPTKKPTLKELAIGHLKLPN